MFFSLIYFSLSLLPSLLLSLFSFPLSIISPLSFTLSSFSTMEDDFVRAFESLRHTHDLLLKDKQSLETCFEQESQERDRLQFSLRNQTEGLKAAIRSLRLQNRDSAEALAALGPRLDRYGCADIAPTTSVILGMRE